jgi:tetratricopeptide (TPR) repeat protein
VAERGVRGATRRPWLVAAWAALVVARVLAHPRAPHGTAGEALANVALFPAALAAIVLPVKPLVLGVVGDLPVAPGLAVMAAVGLAAWKLQRARRRVLAMGAVAFAVLLAPSAAVPGALVLPCRFVLPAFGVLVVAGELARAAGVERRALAAFGGVVVAALALLTVSFEGAFHDERAFAREAVDDAPRSPLAHVCLGQVYQRAGEDDRALTEYRAALAEGPAEVAHNDIAVIAMKRAEWPDAERELRAELAVNPAWATAYANLAIVLRREERPAEACETARRAIALGKDDDTARAEAERDCGSP